MGSNHKTGVDMSFLDANRQLATRRQLFQLGAGLGSVALSWLLHRDGYAATTRGGSLPPKLPDISPRARAIIFLIMEGGPSQIDTFDPKPALDKLHGTVYHRENVKTSQVKGTRYFVRSPFRFRRYGESGIEVSDLFAHVGQCADELAIVRSVHADSDNHPAALFQYNTGFPIQGNPSIGAWVTYGLGTVNRDLPAYVVLRNGKPFGGTSCWSNGFLPAQYQGTQFRSGKTAVLDLRPAGGTERQLANLQLIQHLNEAHLDEHPGQSELEARIASYELAFRMQASIPETIDFEREPPHIQRMYGLEDGSTREFGQRCLLARRLVERGVRFVQVWAAGWDSHDHVARGHADAAQRVDLPIAGLIRDLKQRGLLGDTLVVWGGEFGRTADTTSAAHDKNKPGRDHNPRAMTMWFAGGGTAGGSVIGATDDFGEHAVQERHHLQDIHATMLHLMGLDHELLTYYHGGRLKRLTDTGGVIIEKLLA
jgi:hypothetical protein